MAEILLSHPLVTLYGLYVISLLVAALWSETRRPTRRQEGTEPLGALGARDFPCPGSCITPPTTMPHFPSKEEKL